MLLLLRLVKNEQNLYVKINTFDSIFFRCLLFAVATGFLEYEDECDVIRCYAMF